MKTLIVKKKLILSNPIIMQKVLFSFFLVMFTACVNNKTITLANGKKVSERRFKKMTHKAFEESFGKMTEAEKKLFDSVTVIIDTSN